MLQTSFTLYTRTFQLNLRASTPRGQTWKNGHKKVLSVGLENGGEEAALPYCMM